MNRKRQIFLLIASVFILAVIWVTIDIFSRTSPPGSRSQLPARIKTN